MGSFYEDDEFLRREFALLERNVFSLGELRSSDARRHVREGFDRRILMMQASRIFMRTVVPADRKQALATHEVTELAIHINSYYVNLAGSMDNIAWALKYELGLLEGSSEAGGRRLTECTLFGSAFLNALTSTQPSLVVFLRERSGWAVELKRFRDPAAHRVPLYVPPGIIKTEETLREFRRLDELAGGSDASRGGRARSEIMQEARSLAECHAVFATSHPEHHGIWSIPDQVAQDHGTFLTVAERALSALYPMRAAV